MAERMCVFDKKRKKQHREEEERSGVRAERERGTVIVWCAAVPAGGRGVESSRAGERERKRKRKRKRSSRAVSSGESDEWCCVLSCCHCTHVRV